jgi:hypothetical protein
VNGVDFGTFLHASDQIIIAESEEELQEVVYK